MEKRNKPAKTNFLFLFLQILAVLAALLFIYIGIQRNEVSLIFKKAVRICMECIGLG